MTGYFEIAPARTAGPALTLARFALVLFIVAGACHRFGLLSTPNFLRVAGLVPLTVLAALLFWIVAFREVWQNGRPGGRKLALAAAFMALALAPFAFAAEGYLANPAVSDVTTDRTDPPVFFALDAFPRGQGAARPGPAMTGAAAAVEELSGRRYPVSPELVLDSVQQLIADRGWSPVHVQGQPQVDTEISLETVAMTTLLRFPSDVAIRLTDEGDATYVDMRSASHYGKHDLGDNATRIRAFLADLDAAMLARAGGGQAG